MEVHELTPRLSRRAGRTALEGTTVLSFIETETEMSIPTCLAKYPNVMLAEELYKVGGTCKEGSNSTLRLHR
jgi:hypothetical protein